MGRAGKSLLRSSRLWAAVDDLGRGQKLRAASGQRAALAGALAENLLTRPCNQISGIDSSAGHVRFTPKGGHWNSVGKCPLCAKRWGNRPAFLWIAEYLGCCASG